MFTWRIWKWIEKHIKLYSAYVYDSMIMMSMSIKRPRLKDIIAEQV